MFLNGADRHPGAASARLRTLDALHLASAAGLDGDLAHFVAYDARLTEAARLLGLPVAQPGSPRA